VAVRAPDPEDPSPVRAERRGGKWIIVSHKGDKLPDSGEFSDEKQAQAAATQINDAWARARRERRSAGAS
jgi:hypothetical protein